MTETKSLARTIARPSETPQRAHNINTAALEATPYGARALEDECREVAALKEGERNTQFNFHAFKIAQLVAGEEIPEAEAQRELFRAAQKCGLKDREIKLTMASAFKGGAKEPRSAPLREQAPRRSPTHPLDAGQSVSSDGAGPPDSHDYDYSLGSTPDSVTDQKSEPGFVEPSAFEKHWVTLSSCPNVLIDTPAPQKWLFTRYRDQQDVGVFPRGKTGLLVGAGGVSKTNFATQWGVAVALGGFLVETFKVAEPGHVLMALAEEELDECTRRLWRACNALELSADQRKDIAQRIHLVPLHGIPVALLRSPFMNVYEATSVLADMKKAMSARAVDWACVILDPLARWSGGGAERDNEAATRFVQILEDITKVRGNPSGLVVHHSSQASIAAGSSAPRGVTALHDGFRWVASMDAVKTKDGARAVKLHNGKSNYSPEFDDLLLVRNAERGVEGTLRLATELEGEKFGITESGRELAKQTKKRHAFEAVCDAILGFIPAAPGHTTVVALDAALRAIGKPLGDKTLNTALQRLASAAGANRIVDLSSGAQSKPRQWARTTEAQT
ncbi:MAG TPA: AAA family ATPase [Polyangiaceae bacterium]